MNSQYKNYQGQKKSLLYMICSSFFCDHNLPSWKEATEDTRSERGSEIERFLKERMLRGM